MGLIERLEITKKNYYWDNDLPKIVKKINEIINYLNEKESSLKQR